MRLSCQKNSITSYNYGFDTNNNQLRKQVSQLVRSLGFFLHYKDRFGLMPQGGKYL